MNKKVKQYLFWSRVFYITSHIIILVLTFKYENAIINQLKKFELLYPIIYFSCGVIAFYLYLICGKNPGYAPQNQDDSTNFDQPFNYYFMQHELINLQTQQQSIHNSINSLNDLNDKKSQKSIQFQQEEDLPELHYCHFCNRFQPYRTKHCDLCEKCICKFDHHCFWIGSCVGELNHRIYWFLLLFQTTFLGMTFKNFLFQILKGFSQSQHKYQEGYIQYLIMCLLLTVFTVFTGMLLLYHTFLILTNQTTWEHCKRNTLSYIKIYPKGFYPFDQGFYNNIKQIFFHNNKIRDWKLANLKEAEIIHQNSFNICENKYYDCC